MEQETEKLNLLYLGEMLLESYIVWCLRESKQFNRVDHLTSTTLDFTHVAMDPQPDKIIVKCDYLGKELEWSGRYALDIPRLFITCTYCEPKLPAYRSIGNVFHIDKALEDEKDLLLENLVKSILEGTDYEK